MTVKKIASVVPESVASCAVTFSIGLMYNVNIRFQLQLLLIIYYFIFKLPSAKQVAAIIQNHCSNIIMPTFPNFSGHSIEVKFLSY